MYALIETNGASHIAIHIPHEGAEKSLPAIAGMLENNATFFRNDYQGFTAVTPSMSIMLGDTYTNDGNNETLMIKQGGQILDESFVIATPDVSVSNKKGIERERNENTRIRTELIFVKQQLATAQQQFETLTAIKSA